MRYDFEWEANTKSTHLQVKEQSFFFFFRFWWNEKAWFMKSDGMAELLVQNIKNKQKPRNEFY